MLFRVVIELKLRRGYICGAVKEHREAMFKAAVQSLDGAKPNSSSSSSSSSSVIVGIIGKASIPTS